MLGGRTTRGRRLRRVGSEPAGRGEKERVMNGSHVNEPWDQRVTEHRFTYECWRPPLVLAARVGAGLGVPSAPPTPGLGPRVASLTPGDGGGGGRGRGGSRRRREFGSRLSAGTHKPRSGHGRAAFGPLCDTSSWRPSGVPELGGAGLPLSRGGVHPSWSDPIKMHYKRKKRLGQKVTGAEDVLARLWVAPLPEGPQQPR